uniref:JmjC domain-containing protein n=1 Tax=Strongyloides venezuelensis TaxID=75913 RepID=A0A0K0FRE0_STRVS
MYKIINDNEVIIDNKPETTEMALSEELENMKIEYNYNIAVFELYLKDSYSKKEFFGFCAADCCKIILIGGQSFFLPADWIYAVYTEEDTLLINGNFITSAALETHIKILKSEQRQRAEAAYTYLYFKELMWYTVAATVYDVTGLNYIDYKQFKNIEFVDVSA